MKPPKQKQSARQVPHDSPTPLRFTFDGSASRDGMLNSVRAKFRTMDGMLILSGGGRDAESRSLWLCADLEPGDARAITMRLRDAMAVRRRISGGYSDLIQPPAEMRFIGNTFQAQFVPQFLPQIAARVSFKMDGILLELHGGNVRVRLWLDHSTTDALIFDLERSIQASEEFK